MKLYFVRDILRLEMAGAETAEIELYDALGRLVLVGRGPELAAPGLGPGVYMAVIRCRGKTLTAKALKPKP